MTATTARMEYAQYDMYNADADHHIDLANPTFRQEAYMQHMQQQQAQAHHHMLQQADYYARPMQHAHYGHPIPPHLGPGIAVDVKPRLTKEQHDILESHYRDQNKPNTNTKKTFAESLGVSLDKVNNWFQNRRAKSKQDAKKAASQATQQSQPVQYPASQTNQDPRARSPSRPSTVDTAHSQSGFTPVTQATPNPFLESDLLNSPNGDSAISIDPVNLSSGLGISRTDARIPATMSPHDLLNHKMAVTATPGGLTIETGLDDEKNRRTLTQEQFDSFAANTTNDYTPLKTADSAIHQSPKQIGTFDDYLNDMSEFTFGNPGGDNLTSNDMHADFTLDDAFKSSSSLFPDVSSAAVDLPPSAALTQDTLSDWSAQSTPSLNITPVVGPHDSGCANSDHEVSPKGNIGTMAASRWQPGSSEPVDFDAMDREFREAAVRAGSQSTSAAQTRRSSSVAFSDHHMAFAEDAQFTQSEAPGGLTQSMNDMGLNGEHAIVHPPRGSSMGGGIAARRQRPRPQPLASTSLRSASYCGSMPMTAGVPATTPTGTAPTLRRIKSSNVMGGIASGRIQKNVSGAQRSPLNFTFADGTMSSPKFRRVASYSSANGLSLAAAAALAPPTPLTPTELNNRLEMQRQNSQLLGARAISRQPSIQELREDDPNIMPGNPFSSPPPTPNYAAQYARTRLGVMSENTPPQSAPPTQQSFSNGLYTPGYTSAGMIPGQQAYAPGMPMDLPSMPMMSGQPMQPGQYLEMMQMQQQMNGINGMPGMLPGSRPMPMGYSNMQYPGQLGPQQITPPHVSYSYMTGGNMMGMGGPGHAASKSVPAAEFYVHEYKKPIEGSRPGTGTPRKGEAGPKNYTFANHGPEYYEKTKIKGESISPSSSPDQTVTM